MTDPFDRAVAKEAKLRSRFDLDSGGSIIRIYVAVMGAVTIAWGLVVAGHYLLAGADNVVFQVHAVVYAAITAMEIAMVFVLWYFNRRGMLIPDDSQPPPT